MIAPSRRAFSATDASASGKLAPQRIAAGRTAHRHSTRSSCIVNHGSVEIEGLIGQYGSDSVSTCAVQAIAPHKSSWHQASAMRGLAIPRATAEPRLLPIPRPIRNAATISENV